MLRWFSALAWTPDARSWSVATTRSAPTRTPSVASSAPSCRRIDGAPRFPWTVRPGSSRSPRCRGRFRAVTGERPRHHVGGRHRFGDEPNPGPRSTRGRGACRNRPASRSRRRRPASAMSWADANAASRACEPLRVACAPLTRRRSSLSSLTGTRSSWLRPRRAGAGWVIDSPKPLTRSRVSTLNRRRRRPGQVDVVDLADEAARILSPVVHHLDDPVGEGGVGEEQRDVHRHPDEAVAVEAGFRRLVEERARRRRQDARRRAAGGPRGSSAGTRTEEGIGAPSGPGQRPPTSALLIAPVVRSILGSN